MNNRIYLFVLHMCVPKRSKKKKKKLPAGLSMNSMPMTDDNVLKSGSNGFSFFLRSSNNIIISWNNRLASYYSFFIFECFDKAQKNTKKKR